MLFISKLPILAAACLLDRAFSNPVINSHSDAHSPPPDLSLEADSSSPSIRDLQAGGRVIATPGGIQSIIITKDNCLNATRLKSNDLLADKSASLSLALQNNFAGSVNAYLTGLDTNGQLVMLQADGTFYYPTCSSSQTTPLLITANTAIPLGAQGSTTNISIPGYISSARLWFAANDVLKFYVLWNPTFQAPSLVQPSAANPSDPSAGVNWGFMELTYLSDAGLYANLSYVDFVGLVLGIELENPDGTITQSAKGLPANAMTSICNALTAQSQADGQAWASLCVTNSQGTLLRAISPTQYLATHPTAFSTFWNSYLSSFWSLYSYQTLSIDTQSTSGIVACQVSRTDHTLHCAGSSQTYTRPTASDIFGCNTGPFAVTASANAIHRAIAPRLCAALNRSTLLLRGGNLQPGLGATSYYLDARTNWYSKVVHSLEADGRGYAFSYDDVMPTGAGDASGTITDTNPTTLRIIVGGF